MSIKLRRVSILFFIILSFIGRVTLYATKLGNTSVNISLDLLSKENNVFEFGFSSHEVNSQTTSITDISDVGVDLVFSEEKQEADLGENQVYVWWNVTSSNPFELILSVYSLKKLSSLYNENLVEIPVFVDYTTQDGERKIISSSEGSVSEETVYRRIDLNSIGEKGSIPIDIRASGIKDIIPGIYTGLIELEIKDIN